MTEVRFELWQLITLLLGFFGVIFGFAKLIAGQFEQRIQGSLSSLEKMITAHVEEERQSFAQVSQLQQSVASLQLELAKDYVRREDYVKNQTILEGKIDLSRAELNGKMDRLGERIDAVFIRQKFEG